MNQNTASRILIADDDADDIEIIEQAIHEIDPAAELLKFSNGRMVQQYFEKNDAGALPGLVVLDYNMPELTGAEVLLYMKQQQRLRTIPRIVLSTSNSPLNIRECLDNGADEYIVKPVSWQEMHSLARRLVSLSKQVDYTGR